MSDSGHMSEEDSNDPPRGNRDNEEETSNASSSGGGGRGLLGGLSGLFQIPEDQRLSGILQHLIRTGQVRLIAEESGAGGRSSSDEDEEDGELMNWQEAVQNTDSLMMGGGRDRNMPCCAGRSCQSKQEEKSALNSNDIKTEISLATGQFFQKPDSSRVRMQHGKLVRAPHLPVRLRQREYGMLPYFSRSKSLATTTLFTPGDRCFVNHHFLPNKKEVIARHRTKTFCCDFTDGGDTLITASQDHLIRFYRRSGNSFQEFRNLEARDVGWSILDFSVSPDGRHLIYGTWSEYIHEFELHGDHFERFQAYSLDSREYRFCVFSLRFSSDGEEILAGASDRNLYVFDREERRMTLRVDLPLGITRKLDKQFVKHEVSEFSLEWNPNVELSSACGRGAERATTCT